MTYSVAHVIYGINLLHDPENPEPRILQHESTIGHLLGEDALGTAYCGMGDQPVWVGVSLGQFDATQILDGKALVAMLTPTAQHEADFREAVHVLTQREDVPRDFMQFIRSAEPRVFVTWGSS
jgi:hypothetical protein